MGVGISILIGLKATAFLLFFAFLRIFRFTLLPIPFLYSSVVSFLVAIASNPYINLPILLGKGSDGKFPLWSYVMFGPFLYFVRIFSFIRRFTSREDPYTEVSEGLYVGGWPYAPDKLPPGNPAIIDCTCELPRKEEFFKNAYLCVPTWDTRSPDPGEIEVAVKWACRKRAQKIPVFIHCAYGHGRSVTVMCALLVELGLADDWKSAEKLIKEKRPYIRLNRLHRRALEEWSKDRLPSAKKSEQSGVSSMILFSDS